jgi:hypothetical protein
VPKAILDVQRILGCFLCILILVAAIDRVPDPPVLKPHLDNASALYLDAAQPFSPHQASVVAAQLFELRQPLRLHEVALLQDAQLVLSPYTDLQHAADSSPPNVTN